MNPYVALRGPHTAEIHTLVTLGVRHRAKPHVFKLRTRRPSGFDSHRPLHFSLSGVSLRGPRTRLSLSPSSHKSRRGYKRSLDRMRRSAPVEFVLDGLIRPSSRHCRENPPNI